MTWMKLAVWAGVWAALSFAGTARADPKTIEYTGTHCYAGDAKWVKFSKENWAFSYELTGTYISTRTAEAKRSLLSSHCVGQGVFHGGEVTVDTACEFVDADGDKYYGTGRRVGPKGDWTFIAGTGKWEGIKGGGPYEPVGEFPTVVPGKFQGCMQTKGAYTLP